MSEDEKINLKAPENVPEEEEHIETLEQFVKKRSDKNKAHKRMSKENYGQAKAMWLTGDYTLKDIAAKFDVTTNNLHVRFKKDGVAKGAARDVHQKAAQKALAQKMADDVKKHASMAASTRNRSLQGIEVISKLRGNIIAQQVKSKNPISEIFDDVKTLNELSKGMKSDWDAVKFILDMDKKTETEDELPQLTFRAMTDEDIAKINEDKQAELDELGELDVPDITSEPNIEEIKN